MYGVVMYIWQIFDVIVVDEDYGVFLQVVVFVIDVVDDFFLVGQVDFGNFVEC